VYQAGNITKAAERDVDERVGRAEADFDPYCDGWEEDGDESEEEVATRHYGNDTTDRRCTDS